MCRWFAYLSPSEECLLEDVLITPDHSLAKQVHDHYLPKLFSHVPGQATSKQEISLRNRLFNIDGFGVAWYTPVRCSFARRTTGGTADASHDAAAPSTNLRPALFKTSSPPMNDANFHSICANTATTAVFAHIRAATGATSVAAINNHPFVFGRHTLMHNGIIASFSDIRRPLLDLLSKPAFENVHGSTDSEHLAALYMTYLTGSAGRESWERQYSVQQMRDALLAAYRTVVQLQQAALGAENVQANSLNVCVTDGAQLIAFRLRNHAVEQPPSLYWSTKAGITLNRKYPDLPAGGANPDAVKSSAEHGRHVIVASEPTTYRVEDWTLIEKNHALLVDAEGNCVIEDIEPPSELLALAATGNHF